MKGLDFETASSVDIRVHGLDRYVNSPDFRVLLASIDHEDGQIERLDFVHRPTQAEFRLRQILQEAAGTFEHISAHNAGFERAVVGRMGWNVEGLTFVDSAVSARAHGAAGKLEAAAPQLLDENKMEAGLRLIRKFSVPRADGTFLVDDPASWTSEDNADWAEFGEYCDLDARLSRRLSTKYPLLTNEYEYEELTQEMNDHGWNVDVPLVLEMQRLFEANKARIEKEFRDTYDPKGELNFRSPIQLRKWCRERGVMVTSLDEQHTRDYRIKVEKKMVTMPIDSGHDAAKYEQLMQVRDMLRTKQELGGSSLSKLQTILDMVGDDGRLRNQYLHIGAGQSFRTSGRGVQMQNLKRLGAQLDDVTELFAADRGFDEAWDNQRLARNLRQVFTAGHEGGQLIVGDFAAVESRGLAYLAGEEWKLTAYRKGQDLYKVLASSMLNVPYDQVDKTQRSTGKVGELSCGYGAGAGAVSTFAQKMGMDMDTLEAAQIVANWREANPEIVAFWALLDSLLHDVVERRENSARASLRGGALRVEIREIATPASVARLYPGSRSIALALYTKGQQLLRRVFHGAHMMGRDVCYVKPSETVNGKTWSARWSKNGQSGFYKIYGGKLAGILTQSFCRELFFQSVTKATEMFGETTNCQVIGQFHDEIIVEWRPDRIDMPDDITLSDALGRLEHAMSKVDLLPDFPLTADIKHDFRYIK